jgi:outer membrane protein assembly factor BamB
VTRRKRLGWLGPAIVGLGAAIAIVAAWYIVRARPEVGDVIDTIALDDQTSFVVRGEAGGGERTFVELRHRDEVVWQAMTPPYAGRPGAPGIAWGKIAVTVRVVRNGRAEIFAVAMTNAAKLGGFKLAPGHGPVTIQATGPVTLTDHERSYEVVAGSGWGQLVAIDLATGEALWKQELGAAPVDDGGVGAGVVWVRQGTVRRAFRVLDGVEAVSPSSS